MRRGSFSQAWKKGDQVVWGLGLAAPTRSVIGVQGFVKNLGAHEGSTALIYSGGPSEQRV